MAQQAAGDQMPTGFQYFAVGQNNSDIVILPSTGEYDPKVGTELNRKIRNLPIVKRYIDGAAELLKSRAGAGFIVIKAGGPSRYRAYVVPDTSDAIRAELKDGVLIKAVLGMAGK